MKSAVFVVHLKKPRKHITECNGDFDSHKMTTHKVWDSWMYDLNVGQVVTIEKERSGIEIDCVITHISDGYHEDTMRFDMDEIGSVDDVPKVGEEAVTADFLNKWVANA